MAENTPQRDAIEKLKIISDMAQSHETKQVAKVMIQYLKDIEPKNELGFTKTKKDKNGS